MTQLPTSKNYVLEPEDVGIWAYAYARLLAGAMWNFRLHFGQPAVDLVFRPMYVDLAESLGVTPNRLLEYLNARYPQDLGSAPQAAKDRPSASG